MADWRTILLAVADDAAAAALLVVALAWLVAEGLLAPVAAIAIGAAGSALLAIIAYKTAVALLMKPKVGAGMAGKKGFAVTNVGHDGMVRIEGEYWKASSPEPIQEGKAVKVVAVEGLRLLVAAED